jgi:predicted DsbA family dithiol-disulfide isomerase
MTTLEIELFTDPACPFAFSAEPVRQRLRWHYGEQLDVTLRMIVLTREPGEAEKLAAGAPTLQRTYGMPIHPEPYPRPASSEPACRAVVATRIHAPDLAQALLRRLRVRTMLGGLLDDQGLIDACARDCGIEPAELARWSALPATSTALEQDASAARDPLPAARALEHKLGGPREERRYPAPTWVMDRAIVVPGFNPAEVYETAIANLNPALTRRPKPESVSELLEWADEPLATAEVALIMEQDLEDARQALGELGERHPAGPDAYWTARRT